MMIIDRALALACELGERDGIRRCLQSGEKNYPDLGIDVRDFAGGVLGYSGVSGALSEGTAVGVEHEVSQSTVDEMTEFFRSRGAAPRLTVSPITNPELAPLLARSGYVPVECQNTLVASLETLQGERNERIRELVDANEWAEASARGFSDGAEPDDVLRKISLLLATGGATALEVRDGDAIVSTACYALEEGGVIALFAASTVPSHRRQGWQRALIRERVARAKEAGMRFARVCAEPLGNSERNFRALGFVPLYTRVTWELRS